MPAGCLEISIAPVRRRKNAVKIIKGVESLHTSRTGATCRESFGPAFQLLIAVDRCLYSCTYTQYRNMVSAMHLQNIDWFVVIFEQLHSRSILSQF